MKSITCHNERKLLAGTDPGSRRYCTSYICLLLPTWYCAPGEGDLKDLICVQEVCIVRGHRCARSWPHFEVCSVAWVISPTLSLHCHCHDITPVKTMTSPCLPLLDPFMCPFLPSLHCCIQRTQQNLWELPCCSDPLPYAKAVLTVYQTFDCSPN